jgi:hypothetical protein
MIKFLILVIISFNTHAYSSPVPGLYYYSHTHGSSYTDHTIFYNYDADNRQVIQDNGILYCKESSSAHIVRDYLFWKEQTYIPCIYVNSRKFDAIWDIKISKYKYSEKVQSNKW